MSKRFVLMVFAAAAAAGCTNLTAPDGVQVDGGRKVTQGAPCALEMPDGFVDERGSVPAIGSCTTDSRIRP